MAFSSLHIFSPRLRYVTFFVLAYFIAGTVVSLLGGNGEFLIYETTMLLIMAAVVYMDKRVAFSPVVLWGLALWGLMHLAGGLLPIPAGITEPGKTQVLYNMRIVPWLPKFDQIVHALGFGISTIAAYEALSIHVGRHLRVGAAMIAVLFFIGMGMGALNEVIEFAATLLIPETNVGGYENTGWDMVSNGVGAIIAVLYLRFGRRA